MNKGQVFFKGFIFCVLIGFSPAWAQTDAQIAAIRSDVQRVGISKFLVEMAKAMKAQLKNAPSPVPNFVLQDVRSQGSVMEIIWQSSEAAEDFDADGLLKVMQPHAEKTICGQKVRGMLVKEFDAAMTTKYIDKSGRIIIQTQVDKTKCQ
jgi:hypothetical protein